MPLRCLSKRKSEKCSLNLVLVNDLSERSFSVGWEQEGGEEMDEYI